MSSTREETGEILDNLKGMSGELIRATQDAKKLRKQLVSISNVVENKNYEILSRFLSGTGAWKILNKVKAFTQTISQLSDRSEARIAKEAKTLQGIAKLEQQKTKFSKLSAIAKKAERGDQEAIAELMEKIPEVRGLKEVIGEKAAIKRYSKFITDANNTVKGTLKTLGGKGEKSIFGKISGKVSDYRKQVRFGSEFELGTKRTRDSKTGRFKKNKVQSTDAIIGTVVGDGLLKISKGIMGGFRGIFSFADTLIGFTEKGRERGQKMYESLSKVTSLVGKFVLGFTLFVTAFFILFRILKTGGFIDSIISTLTVLFEGLSFAFGLVWEGLSSIIDGFRTGDFFKVLEGVAYILGGLAVAALTVLATVVVGALTLIYSILKGTFLAIFKRLTGDFNKVVSTIFYIGAGILFLVAFFSGGFVPIIIGALMTAMGYLFEKFTPFAKGGTVSNNGMQLVGEKGPELVKLPVGSRVFSNKDSKNMVPSSGTTNNITVQVSGRVGASDQEIKDIARKVSREIGLQMNRTGSTAVRF